MKTQTTYVAEDGKIFQNEEDCKKYENELIATETKIKTLRKELEDAEKEKCNLEKKIEKLTKDLNAITKKNNFEQKCTLSKTDDDNKVNIHVEENINGNRNVFDHECSLSDAVKYFDKFFW